MFENYKTFKTTFAGRELMVETGKVCGLANGSCWVHYGETVVMVNVTASPERVLTFSLLQLTTKKSSTQ
mgnify:CR=1 FL=1